MQANLLDRWLTKAGDSEKALKEWIADGTPLGIERPIECFKIFPSNYNPMVCGMTSAAAAADSAVDNYLSMRNQPEDAEIEISRLLDLTFFARVPMYTLSTLVGSKGRPARMALIVKEKPDGGRKRRVIVDHKRNGGNDRATVPERPVLPRVVDAVRMLFALMARALALGLGLELVALDFTNA